MKQKKLGLSLRGGAFKGACHLGILKALDEDEIEVECIVGSSVGALCGLSFVVKKDYQDTLEYIKNFDYHKLWTLGSLLDGYIGDQEKVINKGQEFFGDISFEDFKMKLGIQVTNLHTYESEIFTKGKLERCLLASSAFPLLIPPVEIDGILYADGDLSSGFAADFLKKKGAEVTIGIIPGQSDSGDGLLGEIFTMYAVPKYNLLKYDFEKNPVDLLIENAGGNIDSMDRTRCEVSFNNGYNLAIELMPKIKKLIFKRSYFNFRWKKKHSKVMG